MKKYNIFDITEGRLQVLVPDVSNDTNKEIKELEE